MESPAVRIREVIARASAITLVVVLGIGLASTYGQLLEERKAGKIRGDLLEQLQRDNSSLKLDNEQLRALILKQSALLQKLSRGELVTEAELREATTPPAPAPTGPTIIIRPNTPPSASPTPQPTVGPTTTPRPILPISTPTPSPSSLLCVPLLNMCL